MPAQTVSSHTRRTRSGRLARIAPYDRKADWIAQARLRRIRIELAAIRRRKNRIERLMERQRRLERDAYLALTGA